MEVSKDLCERKRKRPLADSESGPPLGKHVGKACSKSTGSEVLPADIVFNIFSRLVPPVKSLLRCRSISKFWCQVIDAPNLIEMLHLTTPPPPRPEEPELLSLSFPYPNDYKTSVVSSHKFTVGLVDHQVSTATSVQHSVPIAVFHKAHKYMVVAICHGLFCFSNFVHGGQAFLFNPPRGEVLMLPPGRVFCDEEGHREFYGIGFDSRTSTYKVVRVFHWEADWHPESPTFSLAAEVYTLGTSSWRQLSSVPPHLIGEMPVSAYGDVHWMTSTCLPEGTANDLIVTFDTKEEEFKLTPHPDFKCKDWTCFRLFDLRGSLAIIDMQMTAHMVVWCLKDYVKKEWAIEYKISILMWVSRNLVHHATPIFEREHVRQVGAWKHGLIFNMLNGHIFLYNREFNDCIWHFRNSPRTSIFSYSGGLISLKNYGNLMAKQVGLGNSFDLSTVRSVSVCPSMKIPSP